MRLSRLVKIVSFSLLGVSGAAIDVQVFGANLAPWWLYLVFGTVGWLITLGEPL